MLSRFYEPSFPFNIKGLEDYKEGEIAHHFTSTLMQIKFKKLKNIKNGQLMRYNKNN